DQEPAGMAFSPRGHRSYLLEINGFVAGGQMQFDWTYSEEIYQRATVESLAQRFMEALRSLIDHCQSPEAGGYTPSDFAEFQWSQWNQADIDNILAAIGEE
ncbi:MAG TPA: condensation domain-containing protein, partial [Candidatus Obscuribacterales bacterium]